MFRDLASFANLMKNAGQIAGQAEQMKARLAAARVVGRAEGVKVEATGDHKILHIEIDEEALRGLDRATLEVRIRDACNDALSRARDSVAREIKEVAAKLGVPGLADALTKFGVGQ